MAHNANFVDKPLRLTSFRVSASIENHGPGEHEAENLALMESVYDIPRSPTPIEHCLNLGADHDQYLHNNYAPVQQRSDPVPLAYCQLNADTTLNTNAKKAPRKPREPSSTRKRRLPVNELALMRTTTSDGLPPPGDAGVVFASPITVIDPIEDSQLCSAPKVATTRVKGSQRYGLKTINSYRSEMLKGPAKPHEKLMARSKLGLRMVSDGFVGTELHSPRKKSSARQGKNIPKARKKPAILRALALGSGPLPDSAAETCDASMALQYHTRYLEPSRAISRIGDQESNTRLGRTAITSSPSVIQSGVPDRRLTQQWHRAIQHQLSSITAPIRRESDSSASESAAEQWSMSAEDEQDTADANDSTNACSDRPIRVPSYVEDTSYIKSAMHRLEMEGLLGSDDGPLI